MGSASLASRRRQSTRRSPAQSIVDGNHDPKAGYGTARAPCFAWSPDDAWVLGDAAFALDDAVAVSA